MSNKDGIPRELFLRRTVLKHLTICVQFSIIFNYLRGAEISWQILLTSSLKKILWSSQPLYDLVLSHTFQPRYLNGLVLTALDSANWGDKKQVFLGAPGSSVYLYEYAILSGSNTDRMDNMASIYVCTKRKLQVASNYFRGKIAVYRVQEVRDCLLWNSFRTGLSILFVRFFYFLTRFSS